MPQLSCTTHRIIAYKIWLFDHKFIPEYPGDASECQRGEQVHVYAYACAAQGSNGLCILNAHKIIKINKKNKVSDII